MGVGMVGGANLATAAQMSVKFRDFAEVYLRYFSTNHFQTWHRRSGF